MEFRLTYAGELLADRDDKKARNKSLHKHRLRRHFHKQLVALWQKHPALVAMASHFGSNPKYDDREFFRHDGFNWFPLVTERNGMICKVDLLILREGQPGKALYDIDNRLKIVFDALRKAKGPSELGEGTSDGLQQPDANEDPFYVLLEDDSLITHVAVTTDTLLEPVPDVPVDQAVRLVIDVTVQPYRATMGNLTFV